MNLAPGTLNLDLSNLLKNTNAISNANGQVRHDSSPRDKSTPMRYSVPSEHVSLGQILTTQPHPKLHLDIRHSDLDSQQLSEDNLKKFYGVDVNQCTDVSTLQHLLVVGFRNFIYTTQWYEATLRERNKTFTHRLGDLKKYIRSTALQEAPQTVVPATRRMRSGSISTETPRPTTDMNGGVKHKNVAGRELKHPSLHTDRGMYMHPHAQNHQNRLNVTELRENTPDVVVSRHSLSRPVMLKKPHSASSTVSQKSLGNRPSTPAPVCSGRKTSLWHSQHHSQVLLTPSSARSRQLARYKDSGGNTNKGDNVIRSTQCRPYISSCKISALMTAKRPKLVEAESCSDMQRQLAGADSSTEKSHMYRIHPCRQPD
ncbi:unnamed protein product [Phytomonas sp. Hart1]|nr:unnamed protein product [Phytomonas sp. Hart1]|eukprot:CCW71220.1 unnamed protein product [Phytomonas sp. isolate Hart1]